MDPEANVSEQLGLAHEILEMWDRHPTLSDDHFFELMTDKGERLAELVLALDDWIQKGGCLPKRWKPEGS